MRLILSTCLLTLLVAWGCDRGPELTPITQEGRNTFSCKVNGKVWIPDGRSNLAVTVRPIFGGFFLKADGALNIMIAARAKSREDIELYLDNIDVRDHTLNRNTQPSGYTIFPLSYGMYRNISGEILMTSSEYQGTITLNKADTITGVISGTFEFTCGNSKGETIRITDGRFDIKSPLLDTP